MMAVLLPLSFALMFLTAMVQAVHRDRKQNENDAELQPVKTAGDIPAAARAFGIAVCVWCLCVYGITEGLSVFHLLDGTHIALCWGVLCCLCAARILTGLRQLSGIRKLWGRRPAAKAGVKETLGGVPAVIVWGCVVLVCSLAGYLAWKTVPYNWDSMAYHLARIPHWIANRSVEHYATSIDRQVFSPMLGEFIMLHVYALANNSDLFVNFVQCASLWICTGLVGLLAGELGCSAAMSGIAALLYASLPIAFAESLTTQVDLVSNVFLVLFVVQAVALYRQEQPLLGRECRCLNLEELFIMSMCIGMGYLTKPSVCLGMVLFLIPILAGCIRRRDRAVKVILCMIGSGIAAALLAFPELLRMLKTYHAFMSPAAGARQMVGTAQPAYLLVNFLKNFFFNLPNIYMDSLPGWMERVLNGISGILQVELNDPSISEDGRAFAFNAARDYGHDTAINSLVVWAWMLVSGLLMTAFLVSLARRHAKASRPSGISKKADAGIHQEKKAPIGRPQRFGWYYVLSSLCFVLFLWILRWEMYETRYEIPYLALLCPALVWGIARIARSMKSAGLKKLPVVFKAAFCMGLAALCLHQTQKMFVFHRGIADSQSSNRTEGYYYWWKDQYKAQTLLCDRIREDGYSEIGLYCNGGYYEYPLWVQLEGTDARLEHILVENATNIYEDSDYHPQAILWMGEELPAGGDGKEKVLDYNGAEYVVELEYSDDYVLLKRADS